MIKFPKFVWWEPLQAGSCEILTSPSVLNASLSSGTNNFDFSFPRPVTNF